MRHGWRPPRLRFKKCRPSTRNRENWIGRKRVCGRVRLMPCRTWDLFRDTKGHILMLAITVGTLRVCHSTVVACSAPLSLVSLLLIDNFYVCVCFCRRGIAWAPACGKAIAELVLDGKSTSVDLSPFDPARFTPAAKRGGRGRKKQGESVGEQW
jgi:hypothetical protein